MGWLIGGIILVLLVLKLTGRLPGGAGDRGESRPDLEGDMLYGGGDVQPDASEQAQSGGTERPDLEGDMLYGGGDSTQQDTSRPDTSEPYQPGTGNRDNDSDGLSGNPDQRV